MRGDVNVECRWTANYVVGKLRVSMPGILLTTGDNDSPRSEAETKTWLEKMSDRLGGISPGKLPRHHFPSSVSVTHSQSRVNANVQ